MKYHLVAFIAGFILDMIFGDPYWLAHPVRWIGKLISVLEDKLNKDGNRLIRGAAMVAIVIVAVLVCSTGVLAVAYGIHPYVGCFVEAVMTYQIIALKCLRVESMKVYHKLAEGDIDGAREAVSMIVGRDTEPLDDIGIAKAAIETVAENTSDGVIAPIIYTAIGGPILGLIYKAVNTMDSMVGYKNDRYMTFGRCAARLDDYVNYIPARISALLMLVGCLFMGRAYDFTNAVRIYRRDRKNHASPNSAQTESVLAGALSIQLAGNAYYFGKLVNKPFIGDASRRVEYADIKRANILMYGSSILCVALCVIIMFIIKGD